MKRIVFVIFSSWYIIAVCPCKASLLYGSFVCSSLLSPFLPSSILTTIDHHFHVSYVCFLVTSGSGNFFTLCWTLKFPTWQSYSSCSLPFSWCCSLPCEILGFLHFSSCLYIKTWYHNWKHGSLWLLPIHWLNGDWNRDHAYTSHHHHIWAAKIPELQFIVAFSCMQIMYGSAVAS